MRGADKRYGTQLLSEETACNRRVERRPLRLHLGNLECWSGAHERSRNPQLACYPHFHCWGCIRLWLRRPSRLRRAGEALRRRSRRPPLVWGSFHLLSVGLAVGATALVGYFVEGFLTWPVGGFIYTTIYLIAAAFESALAYARDHRGEE
jgi:hypothetical protein